MRIITILLLCFMSFMLAAQVNIDPLIYKTLESEAEVPVLIHFEGVVIKPPKDLSKAEKGQYIMERSQGQTLLQARVIGYLKDEEIAYRPFWIVNAIKANVDKYTLAELLDFPEIVAISYDIPVKQEFRKPTLSFRNDPNQNWGIETIQADEVWSQGFEGEGVVIGNQDTGADWMHPALKDNYRGAQNDHSYHWFDAIKSGEENNCGFDLKVPCDDVGHGTHTIGTATANNIEKNIAIAPKAKWIACRNMDNGVGTPSTYLECFEWFLAPTDTAGLNPEPSLAPDIINNSWGCPANEGCNASNWNLMEMAIDQLTNAGVLVVVSAGNSGSGCETINTAPAIFPTPLVVGSTNEQDVVSSFSSRGPVTYADSTFTKPDVVAPGSGVLSAFPSNDYIVFSGTSMAGPQVAGLAALLISADSTLRGDPLRLKSIIVENSRAINTPIACDDVRNVEGAGLVNVQMALNGLQITSIGEAEFLFEVWPNPAKEKIYFDVPSLKKALVVISDVRGKVWMREVVKDLSSLDVSGLPAGVYSIRIKSKNYKTTRRLIIQ